MIYNTSYDLYSFAEQGLIADLREIWAETELLDTLFPGLRSLDEWNGGLYWIPFSYSWSAIYYNKQILDEFGLESPSTWEDFAFYMRHTSCEQCDSFDFGGQFSLGLVFVARLSQSADE